MCPFVCACHRKCVHGSKRNEHKSVRSPSAHGHEHKVHDTLPSAHKHETWHAYGKLYVLKAQRLHGVRNVFSHDHGPHQACGMSARSRRNDRARRKCDARAYCCFSGVGMGVVRDVCGPQPNPMALVGFAGARTNAAFQRCMHEPRHASALPVACVPECRKCMEVCMACAKSACIERARENSVHLCTRRVKGTTPRTKTAPLQANACARPRTE